uniref:Ubiquitin carboxyl-terminal hydrolase n=1 Tax=Solanum tuberosum TaxID=4113 RepID=M1DSA1_SOLTU
MEATVGPYVEFRGSVLYLGKIQDKKVSPTAMNHGPLIGPRTVGWFCHWGPRLMVSDPTHGRPVWSVVGPTDRSLENEDVDSVPPALESSTKIEKIEFSCEKCKIQGPFEKQLLVERASYVAVVHLKRFKNGGFVVQKVDKHVSFPLELDMLLYTNEINNKEMKYNLYAVIVHSNFSNFSGHYYSFIHGTPNAWYKFDCKADSLGSRRSCFGRADIHYVLCKERHSVVFRIYSNPQTLRKSSYPFNFFVHSK